MPLRVGLHHLASTSGPANGAPPVGLFASSCFADHGSHRRHLKYSERIGRDSLISEASDICESRASLVKRAGTGVTVLTPRSIVEVLRAGYVPDLHSTAEIWALRNKGKQGADGCDFGF